MKLIVLTFLILHSWTSLAGTVYLLTSLDISAGKIQKIEKRFLEQFSDSESSPAIHHRVGPKLLHQILLSPDTDAVIWVSHSAASKGHPSGIAANDAILDVFGNDVKKFFATSSPTLRFLGVVGCQSEFVKKAYQNLRGPEIMGFKEKTELFKGLRKVLSRAYVVLQNTKTSSPILENETLEIEVPSETLSASGWFEFGNQVIGYHDNASAQTIIKIDQNHFKSTANKNIKFFRDLEAGTELPLATANLGQLWTLFTNKDGHSVGGNNQQLYLFRKTNEVK